MKIALTDRNMIRFIILITPFLDSANGIFRLLGISATAFSFGQTVRGIIFVLFLIWLARIWAKSFLYIVFILTSLFIKNLFYETAYSADLIDAITFDIRCLYGALFFLIVFRVLNQGRVSLDELIQWASRAVLINAILIIYGYIFQVGLTYAGASKGFFIEQNSLSAVQVWGCCIWIYLTFKNKVSAWKVIALVLVAFSAVIQATKAGIVGVIFCVLYALYYFGFIKKKLFANLAMIGIVVIGAIAVVQYFQMPVGKAVLERWKYFYNNLDLMSFILSGRNDSLNYAWTAWSSNIAYILFGVNESLGVVVMRQVYEAAQGLIEMDLFDAIFFYGIVLGGPIVFFIVKRFIKAISCSMKKNEYGFWYFSIVILLGVGIIGGHVLTSPMAGTYWALVLPITMHPIDYSLMNEMRRG